MDDNALIYLWVNYTNIFKVRLVILNCQEMKFCVKLSKQFSNFKDNILNQWEIVDSIIKFVNF